MHFSSLSVYCADTSAITNTEFTTGLNQKSRTNATTLNNLPVEIILPKATKIKITFEDGSILFAEGPDANSIWGWWQTAQTFAFIHGQDYRGPSLTKITPEGK